MVFDAPVSLGKTSGPQRLPLNFNYIQPPANISNATHIILPVLPTGHPYAHKLGG